MKVYRYLSEDELNLILCENYENLGEEYNNKDFQKINTHKYKDGIRYLHFFKHKEDITKLKRAKFLPTYNKYFICEFNIPLLLLIGGMGRGFYEGSGYDFDDDATEFKMPAKYMKKRFLRSYEYDKTQDNFYEFLENCKNLKFSSDNPEHTLD